MPKQTAAQRAEAEVKAGDGSVPVKWKGKTWHVLPINSWGKSWRRHIDRDDWDSWAECVLPAAEHRRWLDTPATGAECFDFIALWREASGQDEGESQGS